VAEIDVDASCAPSTTFGAAPVALHLSIVAVAAARTLRAKLAMARASAKRSTSRRPLRAAAPMRAVNSDRASLQCAKSHPRAAPSAAPGTIKATPDMKAAALSGSLHAARRSAVPT
jgi:hypothetical protein